MYWPCCDCVMMKKDNVREMKLLDFFLNEKKYE